MIAAWVRNPGTLVLALDVGNRHRNGDALVDEKDDGLEDPVLRKGSSFGNPCLVNGIFSTVNRYI